MKQEINLQISNRATAQGIILILDSHLKKTFKNNKDNDWEFIQNEIMRLGKIADYYREDQLKKESEKA